MTAKGKGKVEAVEVKVTKDMQDFTLSAIELLRGTNKKTGERYACAHSVWSGLLGALQVEFDISKGQAVHLIQEMERKQLVYTLPTKGGVLVYPWGQRPKQQTDEEKAARSKEAAAKRAKKVAGSIRDSMKK